MTLGKLCADADGHHPNADVSWVGQSFWSTLTTSPSGVPAVEGLIQPPPHDVADKPSETLMMMYGTNPAAGFPNGANQETEDQPPATPCVLTYSA